MAGHISPVGNEFPVGEYGPAMRGLTEMQQKFVLHLLDLGGSYTEAARAAGYSANSANSLRVCAHRLAHLPTVIDAIREQGERYLRGGVAIGVHVLMDIAKDPTHKDRLKAATNLLNRAGLGENTTKTVRHVHELSDEQLENKIKMLAKRNGLDASKLLGKEVVDATFKEVPAEATAGLEDLL